MAAVFPAAPDLETYWDNLVGGVDAITEVPAERWDPVFYDPAAAGVDRFYCRRGGFVDAQGVLDPAALGIVPAAVAGAEPDQLLSLALAARALADAGGEATGARRERTGVIVGRGGYLTPGVARLDQRVRVAEQLVVALRSLLPDLGDDQLAAVRAEFVGRLGPTGPETAIDLVPNLAASRVANRLDLGGPAYTVDAACASSLLAVDQAVSELAGGRCDLVLAGGVHLCHDVTLWSVFTQLGALSRAGRCRPFDRRADGLLIGEGGAMLVLQRLEDAERAGSRIYAVIAGTGVTSDGRGASLLRPSVEGQVRCLEAGWRAAGLDPADLGLVEAHGTATPTGDAAEVETLRRVLGPPAAGRAPVALGSVKSMIGHAMPAAGAAGLVKAALALHRAVLPPTLHAEEGLEALAGSGLALQAEAAEWDAPAAARVAAVNAFGFGGINGHVVLTGHPSDDPRAAPARRGRIPARAAAEAREAVLLLAAPDRDGLRRALDEAAAAGLPAGPPRSAPAGGPARLALCRPTTERLDLARRVLERGRPWRGRSDLWCTDRPLAAGPGAVAFVFPGVEPTFEPRVDDVAAHFGLPLPALATSETVAEDLETLGRSLVAVGRLLDGVVRRLGLAPAAVAGQSIGEWSGMISTEMIPPAEVDGFIDTLRPGSLRVPGVAFGALGCDVEAAEALAASHPGVEVSHDNCPHQAIVCGPDDEVAALLEEAKGARILGQILPFRSGFHTARFAPFLDPFRQALARLPLQPPAVPLWSATTCAPYPEDPEAVRALALSHLVHRVRFRELALALHGAGLRLFVQVGVGSLPGLLEDSLAGRDLVAVATNHPKRSGLDQLGRALAACWVEGVEGLDFAGLADGAAPGPASRRTGPLAPLPLASPLVRLDPLVRPAGTRGVAPGRPVAGPGAPRAAVALDALLDAVTDSAAAVTRALADRPAPPRDGAPQPGAPQPAAPQPDAPARPGPRTPGTRHLRLGLDTWPALADHCFYRQPPGWDDPADRFPVVPMTALVELMVAEAEALAPGLVAGRVEEVRALRWLAVAPAVEVALRTAELPGGPGERRIRVTLEGYAAATVVLTPSWPTPPPDGADWPALEAPRASFVTPADLYDDRWLFHGPAYQGVRVLGPLGRNGIDGTVRDSGGPGALLDNAGQLMGFWMMVTHQTDRLALPTSIGRLERYGPPPTGDVATSVRITALSDSAVRADLALSAGGRPWARITGWEDRRFDTDEAVWPVLIWPEVSTVSGEAPLGLVLCAERWRSSAARELMMRRYLSAPERQRYAGLNPRAQRLFLLGRIAVKDAVRRRRWAEGAGPLWPVQVEVDNDAEGRPHCSDPSGPALQCSLAHTAWVGVAAVDAGPVGVDVERVQARPETVWASAFSGAERAVLLTGAATGAAADEWRTRGWAAKEAAGKAAGTGLSGRPKDLAVTARRGEELTVAGWRVATARRGDLVLARTVGRAGP
jgi:3-oxoacyl-(acyl-carrier-protein) synthase/phosphopantetheinyl transferase